MRNFCRILIILFLFGFPLSARADVTVFACEPEWKALVEEIGGEYVQVTSATSAFADPHHIRAKPSLIAAMRKAKLVICSGAGLEVGWLPILLQKSGNGQLQPGQIGYLMAADYAHILEKPTHVDRSMGDVHPEGNPHLHLNPHNIALVATEVNKRLQQIDPPQASVYQQNYEDFSKRWAQAIQNWQQQAAALAGKPVVVHHRSWSYLLHWLKMEPLASLEPKPGIPPTASHLEKVLRLAHKTLPLAILRTPYEAAEASEWLAEKTGAPAIMLPYTIGGTKDTIDLFSLFNETLRLLNEAHHVQQ